MKIKKYHILEQTQLNDKSDKLIKSPLIVLILILPIIRIIII